MSADFAISRNLVVFISLVMHDVHLPGGGLNETLTGANSRFVVLTVEEIIQMQKNAIPNNKMCTKLGINVLSGKQCVKTYNFRACPALTAFRSPNSQAQLLPLPLNNNCPSRVSFQSPIQIS